MREQFPWFFDPTEEELQRLWNEATFSFDANVLLNLYRVDRETTQDYFKIFHELDDRIFLPHEAANQFFQNRRGVIQTEQKSFSEEEKVKERKVFQYLKTELFRDDDVTFINVSPLSFVPHNPKMAGIHFHSLHVPSPTETQPVHHS
ncbi:hypothetical protein GGP89_002870 [Salinibacter ruber]|uniref:PIN like domain-containing protein n=1 Tax=Salinibacter ruber TaxID=146919 RepID=A0A9X2ZMA3_9BACT|nr:PIN-like domain-containing protein [Salinibacter ruber]MCS3859469.1 hypothetical protein [Salinibacter ruber]MCS3866350.1 hypothetical protein [Salinibacter ruber]